MAGLGVVVYDGDCGFCAGSALRLRQWSDGRLDILPWQQADLRALGLTPEQCAAAVQFVAPHGRASGGAAVAAALSACRQPYRAAGAVLAWRAMGPAVEWAYAMVAANRHRLPGATCRASDRDERSGAGHVREGAAPAVPPAHR